MVDATIRELEHRWAGGQGDPAAGEEYLRALERVGADVSPRQLVRHQLLTARLETAGIALPLTPVTQIDPYAFMGTVPGSQALDIWHALRAVVEETGAHPLLLGHELSVVDDVQHQSRAPQDILDAADKLVDPNPRVWKLARTRAEIERLRDDPGAAGYVRALIDCVPLLERSDDEVPTWRDGIPPLVQFSTPNLFRYDRQTRRTHVEPAPEVHVLLLPTTVPWHAAAFLRWGSFNDCPPAEEHVAAHRLWFERYEAEPVAMTRDVVELRVGRPIRDRAEALAMARMHADYCSDATGNEDRAWLAARLLGAPVWHFWWD